MKQLVRDCEDRVPCTWHASLLLCVHSSPQGVLNQFHREEPRICWQGRPVRVDSRFSRLSERTRMTWCVVNLLQHFSCFPWQFLRSQVTELDPNRLLRFYAFQDAKDCKTDKGKLKLWQLKVVQLHMKKSPKTTGKGLKSGDSSARRSREEILMGGKSRNEHLT